MDRTHLELGELKGPVVSSLTSPRGNPAARAPNDGELRVGGRLQDFLPGWESISNNKWILSLIKEGLRIPFCSLPPTLFRVTDLSAIQKEHAALLAEVQSLLQKKVLTPVPQKERGMGFYSSLFLVKKPNGSFRVIINLKPLNKFIPYQKFKMETLKSTLNLLSPGCFMASIDLKDAYYHVPIHADSQQFLRVAIKSDAGIIHLQYRALPFGISLAPRVFTKVIAEMASHIREGVGVFVPYLDDFLLIGKSFQSVQTQVNRTLEILQKLGWILNPEKSSLVPSQRRKFLGIILDSSLQKCFLPQEKVLNIQRTVREIRARTFVSIREGMSLLGLMTAAIPAVPWAQFHSRPLQLQILNDWDHSDTGLDKKLRLTADTSSSLRWWEKISHLSIGSPWGNLPTKSLTTDASPRGWGAHLDGSLFQGSWDDKMREESSNFRELLAVLESVRAAVVRLRGFHVKIFSDNSTTVAYINRQGGTRNAALMGLAYKIFAIAEKEFLSISAVHIKGKLNTKADFLSRHTLHQSEWCLNREVFTMITHLWGTPSIDLFASRRNRQVDTFCSLDPREGPWAVDALSIVWYWDLAYAFPPLPLIPRVLKKIKAEKARVIVIAPFWPKRAWFSMLWEMSLTDPWVLPNREDLLFQGPVSHPQVKGLHLTAWNLKGAS